MLFLMTTCWNKKSRTSAIKSLYHTENIDVDPLRSLTFWLKRVYCVTYSCTVRSAENRQRCDMIAEDMTMHLLRKEVSKLTLRLKGWDT